jgi:dipeptidyl aminopeptidase/acylaminoacyl peptidase
MLAQMRRLFVVAIAAAALPLSAAAAPPGGNNVTLRDGAGHLHALTPALAPGEHRLDTKAAVAPDASRVAFARYTPRQRGIYVVDATGRGLHLLAVLEPTETVGSLVWSPDGGFLLAAINGFKPGWVERIDVAAGVRLKLWTFPGNRWGTVAGYGWAPDGSMLFAATYGDDGPSVLYAGAADAPPRPLARVEGLPPPRWAPRG